MRDETCEAPPRSVIGPRRAADHSSYALPRPGILRELPQPFKAPAMPRIAVSTGRLAAACLPAPILILVSWDFKLNRSTVPPGSGSAIAGRRMRGFRDIRIASAP